MSPGPQCHWDLNVWDLNVWDLNVRDLIVIAPLNHGWGEVLQENGMLRHSL